LTSNTSALPEVAGEAAVLFNPYDVGEICDAIRSALESPALRAELSSKGIERAGRFSWRRTAEVTVRTYRDVLGE
ncbi:MAG: glycosyltransferase family 1 protein, partial [Anaerolineae bacterium]